MTDLPRPADRAYEAAKETVREGDAAARFALAVRPDTRPEILYYLAEDGDADVRRAIAANGATPPHADLILARDADEGVREDLARKIAGLLPGRTGAALARLHEIMVETIAVLARDELPRVRAVVSEALAEVAGEVPPALKALVRQLAADEVLAVAGPVLERSGALSDADLLAIIVSGPPAGALEPIARRAGLGEAVADALADADDAPAIAALLTNESAQIREETLDRILDRADGIEAWHAPLAGRPRLSQAAMVRIAGFVAQSLLDELARRSDLDPETAAAIAEVVARRLEAEDTAEEPPIERARRLLAEGRLDLETLMDAINAGKRPFAIAALAVRGGLEFEAVRDLLASHSAKGATALAWKAGLDMRQAIQVQLRLAGVSPQVALYAKNGTEYPLSEADMEWQLEFFGSTPGAGG